MPREHFTEKVTGDHVVLQPAQRGGRAQKGLQKQRYLVKQGHLGSGRSVPRRLWGLPRGRKELGEDHGRELILIEMTGLCVILGKARAFGEAEAQILNNLLKRPATNNRHRI